MGAILYFCFCPDVIFVKALDKIIWTRFHISISRPDILPAVIRNYMFDFLWSWSLAGLMNLIIGYDDFPVICVFVPICLGVIMETLQMIGLASGTAD